MQKRTRTLSRPTRKQVNLPMRAQLAAAITARIGSLGLTQAQAARLLGITQPRMNALLKDHTDQFSLDALVNLAARAGLRVSLLIARPYRQR